MMKKLKKYLALLMALFLTISCAGIDSLAAGQYKGGIVIEDDLPKVVEEGLMPSKGDVKAAVLMVEFPNYTPVITKEAVGRTMFGSNNSLRSYYKTSSYGMLNISGDVYDWYKAPNNREYYEDNTREYPPAEMLLREVIAAKDEEVDFSKYDSNNDGYVDAVYLITSGNDTGFSSMWWAYMKPFIDDIVVDGKKINRFVLMPETQVNYLIAAHETGHLMGLQDYYDTEKNFWGGSSYYGTDTLMNTTSGELDVLSKWMLGWITPQIVTSNSTISLRPSNEYPDAAVVKTNGGEYDSFFMVEYRTNTNNNAGLDVEGVSVYRVNAKIDTITGAYKYDVTDDELRLIEGVALNIKQGYAIGTSQIPTSYILQEGVNGIEYIATGIDIDNISISNGLANVAVSYSGISNMPALTVEVEEYFANNRVGYTFDFSAEVVYNEEQIYAECDGGKVPLIFSRGNYSADKNYNEYFLYANKELQPGTKYEINIPAGTFTTFDGRTSQAINLEFVTSQYKILNTYDKTMGYAQNNTISQTLPYGDGGFVYFVNSGGSIFMVTTNASGNVNEKLVYSMGNMSMSGVSLDYCIQACLLDDGSYVVVPRSVYDYTVLKVNVNGECTFIGTKTLDSTIMCSAVGNKAYIGRKDLYTCVILNENNELVEIQDYNTYAPYEKCKEKYYVSVKSLPGIYEASYIDENLNLVNKISTEYEVLGADYKDGKYITVDYLFTGDMKYYYENIYNSKGVKESRRKIISAKHTSTPNSWSKMYSCKEGYVFVGTTEIAFDNGEGKGEFSGICGSPVAMIKITDKQFNEVYSYTIDYNGTGNGDTVEYVKELTNGKILCCSNWEDYIFEAPTTSDQHIHKYNNNICVDCGYKLELEDFNHVHIYGDDRVCDICGYKTPNLGPNDVEHFHVFGNDNVCDECGYDSGGTGNIIGPSYQTTPFVDVTYHTHIQTLGDSQGTKKNGEMAGTSGMAKRLENIWIKVEGNDNLGVQYTTHCQTYGWMPWSCDGEANGTSKESKRLEAIKIQLTGADKDKYDVYYRVHAQSYGWLGWAKNGEPSGTAGYGKRLEGIQVVVVKKGEAAPGLKYAGVDGSSSKYGKQAYVAKTNGAITIPGNSEAPNVMYKTHVQTFGWQKWMVNGQMSGTSGKAKRLEGINIKLTNAPYEGDIVYTTHVQKYGWKDGKPEADKSTWKKNGEMSGTNGEAKRLEAICIDLTGEMAEHYDVYYRVHAQTFGWLGWAKNGEESGTAGYAKRLEGIQIVLVPKGGAAPADNYGGIDSKNDKPFIEKK